MAGDGPVTIVVVSSLISQLELAWEEPALEEVRYSVTGLAALILMALALPPLLARLTGGHPPGPVPQLAALAPVAVVPATVAVIIAAATARWLAVLFAIPAVILLIWQLPPRRRISHQPAAGPWRESGSALTMVRLRLLTVNAQGGAADPAALLRDCADAQRRCASSSGTDPAHGKPTGSGRTRAIAAIFPSRSPTWLGRHRTVGALATDSAIASAGSNCGCTASAHRSAGWAAGDVDSCPSARSNARARRHVAA